MESKQLRHFLAIAEHGSVTQAARWLGMAQPALSQSLTRMENDLGVRLFSRTRRGAALTTAGAAIVDEIRDALRSIDLAERRAKDVASGLAGTVRVGVVSSSLVEVLPRALRNLRRSAPDMKVVLREMSNADLAAAVRTGDIDIALMHSPTGLRGGLREEVLMRDRLIAAVPSGMRFAHSGLISIAEMATIGLVTFPQSQLPLFNARILDAFRSRGQPVEVVQEANRTLTVLACVSAGLGVALLPTWIRSLAFEGVQYFEMEDAGSFPSFDVSAVWLRRSVRSVADVFYEAAASGRFHSKGRPARR